MPETIISVGLSAQSLQMAVGCYDSSGGRSDPSLFWKSRLFKLIDVIVLVEKVKILILKLIFNPLELNSLNLQSRMERETNSVWEDLINNSLPGLKARTETGRSRCSQRADR